VDMRRRGEEEAAVVEEVEVVGVVVDVVALPEFAIKSLNQYADSLSILNKEKEIGERVNISLK
jgi:hypothetical protein